MVGVTEVKVRRRQRTIVSPQFKNREEYEKWKQSKLAKGFESADRELEKQPQESEISKSVNQHIEAGKKGAHPSDKDRSVISASPGLKLARELLILLAETFTSLFSEKSVCYCYK